MNEEPVDFPIRKFHRTLNEAFPGSAEYAEYIDYPEPAYFGSRFVKIACVATVLYIFTMIVRFYVFK